MSLTMTHSLVEGTVLKYVLIVMIAISLIRKGMDSNPFGLGSKRAFVAPSNLMYGLARMFQILTNEHSDELSVFRDMHEARKYLSLD